MPSFDTLERFKVGIADHVAIVHFASPPVNAQDRRAREEMVRVFDALGEDADVRAIILTGEGRTFCAGADLKERGGIQADAGGYAVHNRLVRAALDSIPECPKPVIAAVNGAAIGAGCVLALLCDILIVAEDAFLSMTEVDYGMAGGVRHMMRAFSPSDARLAIYTAKRISGPELLRMNVASACVRGDTLLPHALEIATAIAAKPPAAIAAAKRSFGVTEEMSLREGYRYEQSQTAALAETTDTQEALAAFREKRKPVFKGE